jgi:hypothetical protein
MAAHMQLNLPILDQLKDSQNILIAGAGGGFDIFAGLPIYFTLRDMGKNVHLANYSFSRLDIMSHHCQVKPLYKDLLVGATADIGVDFQPGYYPEGFLARWFRDVRREEVPVWMFEQVGPKLLAKLYQMLVEHLNIDAIVLIDGGVDSVMIGDEEGAGTLTEDTISLAAVAGLDVPVKLLACIGFGAELEVSHHNALANMAALVKEGAFLGCCALTKDMAAYHLYEQASRYVWEQPAHHKSQINMRIVSATQGEFGNHHLYTDYAPAEVFVSPLMSVYWFFQADAVAKRSLLAKSLLFASTIEEIHQGMIEFYTQVPTDALRPHKLLPI